MSAPLTLEQLMAAPDRAPSAIHQYQGAQAWHRYNEHLLVTEPEKCVAPPQMWMLIVDPVELIGRAMTAEILDPPTPA